ncbi:hypothetical protein PF001_g27036 [Phytophthora fragariae]|uniref:Transferrin receptor-like dimerisation domain-containing protein n=1 Tax=Phytophthora fragariae TaxID=53985 RepID=A0A6A4BGB3_9STRA|nr:hypothetical protein PF001_g27036 [Phytophthora fragariae]
MGSGSDFTPFYQHLGVVSVNLAFGLTYASYGTYHSTMDSLHYMETQGDPHYASHASMAKWWCLLAMRLANDAVIPFDFSSYALVMHDGLQQLQQRLADADRSVELAQLYAAIDKFGVNADAFQAAALELQTATDPSVLSSWNDKAIQLERQLLSSDGLPHRPWYKHVIFGPGFYEGYAGAAFPGITDCLAFYDDSATIQAHVDELGGDPRAPGLPGHLEKKSLTSSRNATWRQSLQDKNSGTVNGTHGWAVYNDSFFQVVAVSSALMCLAIYDSASIDIPLKAIEGFNFNISRLSAYWGKNRRQRPGRETEEIFESKHHPCGTQQDLDTALQSTVHGEAVRVLHTDCEITTLLGYPMWVSDKPASYYTLDFRELDVTKDRDLMTLVPSNRKANVSCVFGSLSTSKGFVPMPTPSFLFARS